MVARHGKTVRKAGRGFAAGWNVDVGLGDAPAVEEQLDRLPGSPSPREVLQRHREPDVAGGRGDGIERSHVRDRNVLGVGLSQVDHDQRGAVGQLFGVLAEFGLGRGRELWGPRDAL